MTVITDDASLWSKRYWRCSPVLPVFAVLHLALAHSSRPDREYCLGTGWFWKSSRLYTDRCANLGGIGDPSDNSVEEKKGAGQNCDHSSGLRSYSTGNEPSAGSVLITTALQNFGSRNRALLHVLQLCPHPPDAPRYPRDGGWCVQSCLEY